MESLWMDVRYAVRRLRGAPGFTTVAVLTLALGIGLNAAIFSLIDGMLLRPLPYEDSDRLTFLTEWSEQVPSMSFSVANFKDLRDQSTAFESLTAFRSADYTLTGVGEAERLDGRQVTHEFFDTLRIRPLAGRTFTAAEDAAGAARLAVLAEGFWDRRFGRDPGVVGSTLTLNGEAYEVIGVVPAAFHGSWQRRDVFTSLLRLEDDLGGPERRGSHPGIYVVGRLAPGATIEKARTEVETIAERLAEQYPDSNARQSMTLEPLLDAVVDDTRPALLVLLGAVGLVLLIACANVANLLLARGAARGREMALRTALGASRGRVVRQLLTESVALSVAGGLLGILVAVASIRGLLALIPAGLPGVANVGLNAAVLVFAAALSVGTGIVFGLAPALQVSRPDPQEALREGGRTMAGGGHHRLRQALVVVEVSLSLVLLVGAGLLLRSFVRIVDADPGFDADGVLTASLRLPQADYDEPETIRQFHDGLLERVRALPGVRVAGSTLPLLGGWQTSFRVEGRPEPEPGRAPSTDISRVSPDYFAAMGVRLLRGRVFDERDHADALPVAVIDETFANTWWPGEDPLGQRIRLGEDDPWLEVVGVVAHVKNYGVDQDSRVETYVPFAQSPIRFVNLVVRTEHDRTALAGALRRAVLDVDPNVPLFEVRMLDDLVADNQAGRRIAAFLTGAFAVLALLLAALGIYGVLSYSVTQQIGEIGIRLALGASRRDILTLVVGRGMLLTLAGLVVGLAGALALGRVVSSMLFRISPADPPTFSVMPVVLVLVALAACYLPARRAMRVEPSTALRYE